MRFWSVVRLVFASCSRVFVRPPVALFALVLLLVGMGGPTAAAQFEGKHPRLVFKNADANELLITLAATNELAVWDAQNDELKQIISLVDDNNDECGEPRSVAYTNPGFIWVACFGSDEVWIVDEATDDVVQQVEGIDSPWELDHSATKNWVVVSNWGGEPGPWDPSQPGDRSGTVTLLEADDSDSDFGTRVPESELPENAPNPIEIPSTGDGGPWGAAACEGIFFITQDGTDTTYKLTIDPFALEIFDKGELPWEVECRAGSPMKIGIANGGIDDPPEGGTETMTVDGPTRDVNGEPVQTSFATFPNRENPNACWNTIFDSWSAHQQEKYSNHRDLPWYNEDTPPAGSADLTRARDGSVSFTVITLFANGECTYKSVSTGSGPEREPWAVDIGPNFNVYLFDMHEDTVTEFDPSTGETTDFPNQCYTALRDGALMEVDGTRKLYTVHTGDHDISSQENGEPADYDYSDAEGTGGFEWWNLDTETHKGCHLLPVEFAQFGATLDKERSVHLTWQTASETNNAGFRVQHRAPTEHAWQSLGFVESKASGGTTAEAQVYRFDVEDLSVGTHRFRLRQKDLDGTTDLSKVVRARVPMQEALRLTSPAPNPVSESATLSFAVKEKTRATVTVYNVLGQQVATLYEGTPTPGRMQSVRVHTDDLPSGTYVVRLTVGDRTKTERLTVLR